MEKTLIEKICILLIENNINADYIYFNRDKICDEIHSYLIKIESKRKGIVLSTAIDHTY